MSFLDKTINDIFKSLKVKKSKVHEYLNKNGLHHQIY